MKIDIREEYKTALFRGIATSVVGGALMFFTLWPQGVGSEALISATAIAALTPIAAFLGLGVNDARRNDKPSD